MSATLPAASARRRPPVALLATLERRPVLAVFLIALGLRAIAAVIITAGWGGSLFLDDASYSRLAQAAADGTLDELGYYPGWLYERTGTLLVPVTGLYEVFGPVKLAGQLYVSVLGAATTALTTRLALELVDRRWALVAGLLLAVLPSQILWSSVIMKDAAVWACLSALAVAVAIAARSTGRRLALTGLVAAVLLGLLGYLRLHTLEVASVALFLAMLVSAREGRPVRVAGALALLVCVPIAFGMGPAGAPFVADAGSLADQREANAAYADSAVVTFDSEGGEPLSAELSYLPTGLTVVALRPWPWETSSGSAAVRMARAEALVWYAIVALAFVGLSTAWGRRRVLAFPLLCGGAVLVMYGLTEGNLGTAYRHRGEIVWVVALLAALGAERLGRLRQARAGVGDSASAT
jgi:hypothetical protein